MAKATKNKTEEPLEKTLWKSADKLRKNMDAAEYKHIVLGLIFLKYISDAFEELHTKLAAGEEEYEGADPEDADEYRAENVFFVAANARWSYLQSRAKLPEIGKDVDAAVEAIEKENATLKGVLPKQYARQNLDKASLGTLIDMISGIGLGDAAAQAQDVLGRVYEYFLGEFAAAEGKKGGQFYTPGSIVKVLVNMLEPYKGRVYDPACGSGGMFVQAEKLVEAHQGRIDDISIYGQESNQTTYRLCRMNLAIRGSNVRWNGEGSFLNDAHKQHITALNSLARMNYPLRLTDEQFTNIGASLTANRLYAELGEDIFCVSPFAHVVDEDHQTYLCFYKKKNNATSFKFERIGEPAGEFDLDGNQFQDVRDAIEGVL